MSVVSGSSPEARPRYVVPRYRPSDDAIWYHVLHGNVPGYQIDFMYCPEVPHRAFTQNHFGHLARLMKYLEPRERAPYAFALGNLSRDDVQHEPGHGGVALILGLRVHGVLDHAGRAMPPYAHAILAVDRALDKEALVEAALALHQRLLPGGSESELDEDTSDRLYRRYARAVSDRPGTVERLLRRHVDGFSGLPRPAPSRFEWSFIADEPALQRRITITHADDAPFERLAQMMARLGAMLYRSNVKWTAISSGREFDVPGGVSVRLVPESEVMADPTGLVVSIDAIPEDEVSMARTLFGASPRAPVMVPARGAWRERYAAQKAADADGSRGVVPAARGVCPTLPLDPGLFAERDARMREEAKEVVGVGVARARAARRRLWLGVGLGAAGAGVCALAAIVAAVPEAAPNAASSPAAVSSAAEARATATSARQRVRGEDLGGSFPGRERGEIASAARSPAPPSHGRRPKTVTPSALLKPCSSSTRRRAPAPEGARSPAPRDARDRARPRRAGYSPRQSRA